MQYISLAGFKPLFFCRCLAYNEVLDHFGEAPQVAEAKVSSLGMLSSFSVKLSLLNKNALKAGIFYLFFYDIAFWKVKISFLPDVWMVEEKVVSKEGGDFVVGFRLVYCPTRWSLYVHLDFGIYHLSSSQSQITEK